jgi:hypothetical protein
MKKLYFIFTMILTIAFLFALFSPSYSQPKARRRTPQPAMPKVQAGYTIAKVRVTNRAKWGRGEPRHWSVSCPSGTVALGGGAQVLDQSIPIGNTLRVLKLVESYPSVSGGRSRWNVTYTWSGGPSKARSLKRGKGVVDVYAVCARLG